MHNLSQDLSVQVGLLNSTQRRLASWQAADIIKNDRTQGAVEDDSCMAAPAEQGGDNMKILILNGSPKRDKSDTMHMTRAFVKGMNEIMQNEVTVIDVIDKQIKYCTGCFTCMRNGGTCIHKDDMGEILKQIFRGCAM